MCIGFISLRKVPMAGPCKHGERSGSIKGGEGFAPWS